MVNVLVIRAAGTNCDAEMVRAFELAGARASLVHVDRLVDEPRRVRDFDIIAFPGGFSYGDDIASGRILAVKLREKLGEELREAARGGVPMFGACNGFQVMVQVGLLPGPGPEQTASLSFNTLPSGGSGFVDRWVKVKYQAGSVCVWTKGLGGGGEDVDVLPIAHGEGRFVVKDAGVLEELERSGQVAVRYNEAVNGSAGDIAGVCDAGGRVLAMMPHPERYLEWTMHPYWTRLPKELRERATPGLMMFENAVRVARGVGV